MTSLKVNPFFCLFNPILVVHKNDCNLNLLILDYEKYDKMIKLVKKETEVTYIDTHLLISNSIPFNNNTTFFYRDSIHLSYYGSLFFADKYEFLINNSDR